MNKTNLKFSFELWNALYLEYALFSIQLRIRTKDETHNNENKFDGVYIINQNDPSDLQHSTSNNML